MISRLIWHKLEICIWCKCKDEQRWSVLFVYLPWAAWATLWICRKSLSTQCSSHCYPWLWCAIMQQYLQRWSMFGDCLPWVPKSWRLLYQISKRSYMHKEAPVAKWLWAGWKPASHLGGCLWPLSRKVQRLPLSCFSLHLFTAHLAQSSYSP